MGQNFQCYKCGAPVKDIPKPFSRMAECKQCHARLHVCRMCEFYDPHVADQCLEPVADFVKEKERANFCDYFKIAPDRYQAVDNTAKTQAKSDLNALFGLDANEEDMDAAGQLTPEEEARKKLNDLFEK